MPIAVSLPDFSKFRKTMLRINVLPKAMAAIKLKISAAKTFFIPFAAFGNLIYSFLLF